MGNASFCSVELLHSQVLLCLVDYVVLTFAVVQFSHDCMVTFCIVSVWWCRVEFRFVLLSNSRVIVTCGEVRYRNCDVELCFAKVK